MKVVQDDMSVGQSYERVSWSSEKYCEIWSKMHVFPVKIPFCVKYMRVWEKVIGGKCLLWDRVQHSKLLQKAPYHVNEQKNRLQTYMYIAAYIAKELIFIDNIDLKFSWCLVAFHNYLIIAAHNYMSTATELQWADKFWGAASWSIL